MLSSLNTQTYSDSVYKKQLITLKEPPQLYLFSINLKLLGIKSIFRVGLLLITTTLLFLIIYITN